jgi:alkylhydroperoxidase family enzyme
MFSNDVQPSSKPFADGNLVYVHSMAWIEMPDDRTWQGELGEFGAEIADKQHGRVDNILAVHALDVGSMRAHHGLYMQVMKGTKTLRKVEREMVALIVSKANECHY